MVTYRNPETGQLVKAQFTNSWMFEKQGLRLFWTAWARATPSRSTPCPPRCSVFIGDAAADAAADAEMALEKATATRGLLAVQHNEADLYGYIDENEDALARLSGRTGRDAPWSYGLEITRLVMAAYMAAERRRTVDLTDPATRAGDLHPADPAGSRRGGAVARLEWTPSARGPRRADAAHFPHLFRRRSKNSAAAASAPASCGAAGSRAPRRGTRPVRSRPCAPGASGQDRRSG